MSISGKDMSRARAASTVDIALVRSYLHGSEASWNQHVKIADVLSSDPLFDKSKRPYMSRTELFETTLAKTNRIFELEDQLAWTPDMTERALQFLDDGTSLQLHQTAFSPVFQSQASLELLGKYGALVRSRGIIGCYLQTELGHGSNVARLETTATYIPSTQEFEIHSPTLTSRKWWIGSLGVVSTHGVVQAKLILPDGKDVGPHLFFVQLRSLEDHSVLPNITIGDIGPKAFNAWGATDHGFAVFNRLRIPRENMLSKFAQVTEDGRYLKPPHAKISYGGMMYIRSSMVTAAGWAIAKAATISIRYGHIRRQGNVDASGTEQQVITYPSTYYRLLPILARAYVFIQLGRQITLAFASMSKKLATGDTSLLAEMHATTSGLKVFTTTATVRDIETARRSMGGHGFHLFSGLSRVYAQYLPSATFEGDNFVLDHQVNRAALKAYTTQIKAPSSQALSPSTMYLRLLNVPPPVPSGSWTDPAKLALLLEHRAARVVNAYAQSQAANVQDAGASHRVSIVVTGAFVAAQVAEMVRALPQVLNKDAAVLTKLYTLYLLTEIEAALADLFAFNLLPVATSSGQDPAGDLRAAIANLCSELLSESIGLTDAFGFTDWELDSALGISDGHAYEQLVESAKTEPLNNLSALSPAYEESIRPMLKRGQRRATREGAKL